MRAAALLLVAGWVSAAGAKERSQDGPPNFVIIMADDLGFSDLGCYGGEIDTPNLDGLAKNGLRFTQFYNTARCWPTRAALMTGYYAQQVRRDVIPGPKATKRGTRPRWAPLLPRQLKPLGYRSYHSGKWHIDGMPLQNGFDRSYYLKDQGRFFSPQVHWKDDKKLPPVERGTGYYGTIAVADHAIEVLKEHAADHSDRPFLSYIAFAAPHFPLHALPEDIERNRDRYREGWEAVRAARWNRQREMGMFDGRLSEVEREVGPPYAFPDAIRKLGPGEVNRPLPWAELTPEQKAFQSTKMAVHAAMVDRMDREIGRILDQLRAMKAFENTLVLFLSDNGASAEIMVRADGHDPDAAPGSAASYLCLGPGWSTTSNTPFRRHKTWVHEGGTATPLVAHWPAGIKARGEFRRDVGHVIDVVPTVLELAGGADAPKVPRPGRSLVAALTGKGGIEREYLWWYHEGNRAIRVGDWKLVQAKGGAWELFDLSKDRAETRDLSASDPDRASGLEREWNRRLEEIRKVAAAK